MHRTLGLGLVQDLDLGLFEDFSRVESRSLVHLGPRVLRIILRTHLLVVEIEYVESKVWLRIVSLLGDPAVAALTTLVAEVGLHPVLLDPPGVAGHALDLGPVRSDRSLGIHAPSRLVIEL